MDATGTALGLYILWTILLIFIMVGYRTKLVMSDKHSVVFNADGSDAGKLGHRITRAHANCVESAVFIVGTLLLSLAMNQQALTDPLAYTLIGLRIIQSLVHMSSGAVWAIGIRGLAFIGQLLICIYWLVIMLGG